MVRITRKKKIYSIPELRRSFEHIEEYVDSKIQEGKTKDHIVKDLKKEWKNVFFKELTTQSAKAFVDDRNKSKRKTKWQTKRHMKGQAKGHTKGQKGGGPIAGAPLDYTTRQGIYLPPGQIPVDGHLPSNSGNFGSCVDYVSKGFWNPEPAHSYDPVQGQTRFPTSVPVGMGSNTVGGKRTLRCKRSKGSKGTKKSKGGFLVQRLPSSIPASPFQDLMDISKGMLPVGPSPHQIQRI